VIARTALGRIVAVCLSLAVSQIAAPMAYADGSHLVAADDVATRLASRAAERDAQVRAVQVALDTDEARRQAGLLGASLPKLRAAVPHLSDRELADLSSRAAGLKDVAAGHRHNDEGLVILAIVLVVAAAAILIAASHDGYYDDCGCYY
jgi:hypothetical protein